MPDTWQPNFTAFTDGLQIGIYVGLSALVVLIVITAIRRVLSV
jgi:hypothetical protein